MRQEVQITGEKVFSHQKWKHIIEVAIRGYVC